MLNLYESVRTSAKFNTLEIGEFLFTEYPCPLPDRHVGVWAHSDYLIHVVSGTKIWHTTTAKWTATAGQSLFFKKGAAIVEQDFSEEFCLFLFFVPDDFVREVVAELDQATKVVNPNLSSAPAIRVEDDVPLSSFYQSMMAYFTGDEKPAEPMLRVKMRELITGILTSRRNQELADYLRGQSTGESSSIAAIMEENFRYNLPLEDFANLCHRSLSSFKRDFRKHYDASPGRWLLARRLERAAVQLKTSDAGVSQIAFDCGFEDLSHFSKAFKKQHGVSPSGYRDISLSGV